MRAMPAKVFLTVSKVSAVVALATGLLLLPGCARKAEPMLSHPAAQKEMKPAPPTPIAQKKQELNQPSWDPQWDRIVEQALPPELLAAGIAREIRPFCPRFDRMSAGDKRAWWAYFFQALAGAEAGLQPTTNVRHTEPEIALRDAVSNRMVRSEGLLQLTYMDAQRYGCAFDWEHDKQLSEKDPDKTILRPANNLECGIRIVTNQLVKRRVPLLSRSSYWSTLQPGRPSYLVFAKQMTNAPAACRVEQPPQEAAKAKLLPADALPAPK